MVTFSFFNISRYCRGSLAVILGINTNLRASDLLGLTAGQVRGFKPGDDLEIREKKTAKLRRITLNKACINAINGLLASRPYIDEDPLFQGQRGPITVSYFNRLVKNWAKSINNPAASERGMKRKDTNFIPLTLTHSPRRGDKRKPRPKRTGS